MIENALALIYIPPMTPQLAPGLGELLRHLIQLLDGGAALAYQREGLRYRPRFTPVMRVLAEGAHTIGEITARLAISQGAVSQTVGLMATAGLVARSSGCDGRQMVVTLSDDGQALLERLQRHWEATFRAIDSLEEEVGAPLRTLLSRASAALERQDFAERIALATTSPPLSPTAPLRPFAEGGEEYARYRPNYPAELVSALATLAPGRGLAVDVGCGSGQLSVLLAGGFKQVIGIDVSGDQLAHAVSHPRVNYREGTAEALAVADGAADLIVAAQAAHWFDLPRFYQEVRRIARPGALLALVSYGVPTLTGGVNATLQRFYWRELAPYWAPERRHVESAYAELPFPFEELEPPPLAIQRQWDQPQLLGYLNTWSAVRRAAAEGRTALLQRFETELAERWGTPTTRRQIQWPLAIRLGRIAARQTA